MSLLVQTCLWIVIRGQTTKSYDFRSESLLADTTLTGEPNIIPLQYIGVRSKNLERINNSEKHKLESLIRHQTEGEISGIPSYDRRPPDSYYIPVQYICERKTTPLVSLD